MPFVSTSISGRDGVLKTLAALRQAVKDLRPFWKEVFAPKYFGDVQTVFASEGRRRNARGQFVRGGPWVSLSPGYAKWKRIHAPGKKILELTGELKGSLRWNGSSLGPGGVFDAHPGFVIVGTRVKHAAPHQHGVPQRNLPARPFLDPPDPAVFAPLLKAWIQRVRTKR